MEHYLKSPRDRYNNDSAFRSLVDMMVHTIMAARYTPSEMREAAILASIIYQEQHTERRIMKHIEISNWLDEDETTHYKSGK